MPGEGYWELGDHKLQLDFWPFNHKPARRCCDGRECRSGIISTRRAFPPTFYDLPSNYPPSPSQHGHHRCLSGMGTPDMLGTYGTYQHFAEDGPRGTRGGRRRQAVAVCRSRGETAAQMHCRAGEQPAQGAPADAASISSSIATADANAAVIEVQGAGSCSSGPVEPVDQAGFRAHHAGVRCRTSTSAGSAASISRKSPRYFRLYVTPINIDPPAPACGLPNPGNSSRDVPATWDCSTRRVSRKTTRPCPTACSPTTSSQAGRDGARGAAALLDYALENYDDGLLFFYFSSTDLQSHMFWWDSDAKHPVRSPGRGEKYFGHAAGLYPAAGRGGRRSGRRYGRQGDDHRDERSRLRQFRAAVQPQFLAARLRLSRPARLHVDPGRDVDWSRTRAYGLGINGLYLNLKGRERDGIVEPGHEREELLEELAGRLEAVRDIDGRQVIRASTARTRCTRAATRSHRSDRRLQPRLPRFVGHVPRRPDRRRLAGQRLGLERRPLLDASEVPGVLFSNRPIAAPNPALVDLAPSILTEFGLEIPSDMTGRNIF